MRRTIHLDCTLQVFLPDELRFNDSVTITINKESITLSAATEKLLERTENSLKKTEIIYHKIKDIP